MNVLPGWHFCHFLHQSFVTWMTGMTLLVGITGKPFRSSTTDVTSWPPPSLKWATVCLNILDSAKAEYCTSFHFSSVRPCTGGTSKFFQCIKAYMPYESSQDPSNPFFPGYLCIPDHNTPNKTTLPTLSDETRSRDHFWDQNGLKPVSRPFWDQNVTLPRVTRLVSRPYSRPKWSQFRSRDQYRHQNVTLCFQI